MVKKTTPAKTEADKRLTAIDLARQFSGGYKIAGERIQGALRDVDQNKLLHLADNMKAFSRQWAAISIPPTKITSVADIGVLVRAARERQKLSQQSFADLAGVGRRFLSELENGKGTLEFDKVLKVAAASGIDLFAKER